MCSQPVLKQPNFNKKFFLQTNASKYGMGAVLSQEGEFTPNFNPSKCLKPKLHPIAYYSATFIPVECNYNIYKRELLAMMKSLAHWRQYLGWTKEPFTILTNHANLQYWKSPRNLNWCTAQWHADLQEYDYKIQYIPGKTNIPTDTLSQPPGVDQGNEDNRDITMIPPEHIRAATQPSHWMFVLPICEVKRAILHALHDHPTVGHPGRDETIWKVQEKYWWPGMHMWISKYVKGCAICQQSKNLTHWKCTLLYRIPTKPDMCLFQSVAMDLITGLPLQKEMDAILIIVNHRYSRAAVFLPCNTTIMGPGIMQLYLNNVYW